MSKADLIFINNIREILSSGYDDSKLDVRPRWSDGEWRIQLKVLFS